MNHQASQPRCSTIPEIVEEEVVHPNFVGRRRDLELSSEERGYIRCWMDMHPKESHVDLAARFDVDVAVIVHDISSLNLGTYRFSTDASVACNGLMCVGVAYFLPPFQQALLRCTGTVGDDVFKEVVVQNRAAIYLTYPTTLTTTIPLRPHSNNDSDDDSFDDAEERVQVPVKLPLQIATPLLEMIQQAAVLSLTS